MSHEFEYSNSRTSTQSTSDCKKYLKEILIHRDREKVNYMTTSSQLLYQINSALQGFGHGLDLELEGVYLVQQVKTLVANGADQELLLQDLVELEDDLDLGH